MFPSWILQSIKTSIHSLKLHNWVSFQMATLRNKWNLAAVNKENQEEHPRNNFSRHTTVTRISEYYITQSLEGIERRVTKKLSQEFSRTQSRILGALSKLDEFLLDSQLRVQSEATLKTSQNLDRENQEPNEDRSQVVTHPEVSSWVIRSSQSKNMDPDSVHYNALRL